MNKELFDKLDTISDKVFDIEIRTKRINETLDQLIAALHNYDDGLEMFDDEPKLQPCSSGHDAASWDEEEQLNKRMDIIGQNGNEGTHYVTNEEADEDAQFSDYGMRIAKAAIAEQNTKSWMDEYKPQYDKLLNSGMMFEFHPTWTGEWDKDKFAFTHEHKFNNKKKVDGDKDKSNNTQPKQKQYWKNKRSKRNDNKK